MASHNELGKKGEKQAAAYLAANGYEIIDENWTEAKFEIDIVALWQNKLVFIEVKTRSSTSFGTPDEFVDISKQKQLQKAAQAYIEIMDFNGEIRFDIIAITTDKNNNFEINHIEDAFWFYE